MAKLVNLARMTTATVGTGTLTLGSAVAGFLSFASAGVSDGDIVSYAIKDGANSEIGFGTYTAAGTTLTRNVINSTNSNNAISLSGSAEVFVTPSARDFLQEPVTPGGRLTLVTGTPIMTTTQASKTTIFYTPYLGNYVPLYDGTTFVSTEFSELSQLTTDATKSPAAAAADACYDMFVWNDAGTLRCTRGPLWANTSTVTLTIASPCVVTWNAHGLLEGTPITFSNSGGALPTGITAGTIYYVAQNPATNTFSFSTSVTNAMNNTRVNTSGTQSGTQSCTSRALIGRGTGAGTSQLTLTKGIWLNTNAITNGPAALRGTYVGTIRTDASSQVNWHVIVAGSGGGVCRQDVWNMYNRVKQVSHLEDNGTTYTYSATALRATRGSVNNRIWFTFGQVPDLVEFLRYGDIGVASGANASGIAMGFDSTIAGSISQGANYLTTTGSLLQHYLPDVSNFGGVIGSHFVTMLESADGSNATTFQADSDNWIRLMWMS